MSEPNESNTDTGAEESMPIELAGSRTRLEHYRRERRNSLIAVLGLLVVGSLVVWAVYRFVNS